MQIELKKIEVVTKQHIFLLVSVIDFCHTLHIYSQNLYNLLRVFWEYRN